MGFWALKFCFRGLGPGIGVQGSLRSPRAPASRMKEKTEDGLGFRAFRAFRVYGLWGLGFRASRV